MVMKQLKKNSPRDPRLRSPRFQTRNKEFSVQSRTIGSNLSYKLRPANISRSGLLLASEQASKIPYILNTLVELEITTKGKGLLHKPVMCLGKVVRRDDQTDGLQRFGIIIVQMESADCDGWDQAITVLEQRKPKPMTANTEVNMVA